MTAGLIAALQHLAGADVAVAVRPVAGPVDPLWPAEQLAMARAIPSRQAEYAAGRSAARAAMQMLGLTLADIPTGPDRAPVWPSGIVGSISHTRGLCVAMVARAGAIRGIGVDLELSDPLPADLWPEVLTIAERADLDRLPDADRGRTAKLIFSAKECTYKCIYPQIQTVLGFWEMEIRIDPVHQTFAATLLKQAGPIAAGTVWGGGYALTDGLIAAVIVHR